jgi:hypothetical protein
LGKSLGLNLPKVCGCAVALIGLLCSQSGSRAQENFSAKPPAQLFASDCTGSGCHKSPQGLARTQGFGSLAGFLREHYTNSRESAAALANYLSKLPSGPEPREARTPRGKPATAATASGGPAWLEDDKPEGRASRRNSRTGSKPDDEPATAAHHPSAEPEAKPEPKSSARERRGRQPATAAAEPPVRTEPEAAPAPPPAPSAPPAPAPPPAPKQYDIFD